MVVRSFAKIEVEKSLVAAVGRTSEDGLASAFKAGGPDDRHKVVTVLACHNLYCCSVFVSLDCLSFCCE